MIIGFQWLVYSTEDKEVHWQQEVHFLNKHPRAVNLAHKKEYSGISPSWTLVHWAL